jgi:hypothetical protein
MNHHHHHNPSNKQAVSKEEPSLEQKFGSIERRREKGTDVLFDHGPVVVFVGRCSSALIIHGFLATRFFYS